MTRIFKVIAVMLIGFAGFVFLMLLLVVCADDGSIGTIETYLFILAFLMLCVAVGFTLSVIIGADE